MDILQRIADELRGKENVIFFELGSNDGYHTKQIHRILESVTKSFKYYAFEMVNKMYNISLDNLKGLSNIEIHNLAISDKSEQNKEYYFSSNIHYNGSSSIKEPTESLNHWPDLTFTKEICNTISIDEFCKNKINHIDFIWADIQGAEDLMIKGMSKILPNVNCIYTEYAKDYYDGALGLDDIRKLLPGFDIVEDYKGDVLLKRVV